MNKLLLCLCALILSSTARSQGVIDGPPMDSVLINFTGGPIPGYLPDTATAPLWQIGLTHKTFFAPTPAGVTAIMTDTVNHYPANANNYFTLKVPRGVNAIVDLWHRYETDTVHAGGIVEFSMDNGLTWENVLGPCNIDSGGMGSGILTSNFYSPSDTIYNGEKAFTGTTSGQKHSRLQFFIGLPLKTTSGCSFWSVDTIYLRFRFVSDTTNDTLAGWIIDSIAIEQDYFGGKVQDVATRSLKVSPTPSTDGVFNFPVLANENDYSIWVGNAMGQQVLLAPYSHKVDLGNVPPGIYFYKVTDGTEYYSGRLLKE